ncbi:XRE family transcriptional regulator [Macrococcoides goetzii]|uniref:XRE family transcriptional regulator n=1 Tax=Macrococcoides goetzii TaxID=1891097 RepID=A0A2G5NUZ5_9STAP|nr:hypothetical protein [Macrococcus goetzii]RAI79654.1 XRE family transcriptional regulator [Macrococcus goetzii]
MRKEIELLLSSNITGYQIEKETGVRQSTISNIRLGKSSLDTLPFAKAEALYNFAINSADDTKNK